MIGEHYAAIEARLEGDSALAGRVHDSARMTDTGALIRDTYVIVFGGTPDELDDDRLTAAQLANSDATFLYTVRSVSVTAAGARATAGKVFARLVGFIPTIDGRSCSAIRHTRADQVEADTTVTPPLYYADDDYELRSTRA